MATTTTGTRAPESSSSQEPRRWAALGFIGAAQLLTALDATIVSIALPTAQADLGFTDANRSWVVTAYTVAFAGLLLIGGRLADRWGRRRTFLIGLGGFAAASALAGLAPTFEVLLAGRALQGAFAAVIAPTALSLVFVLFRDAQERGRAFAVYGAIASSGAALGLVAGGALTEFVDWRWCLLLNVVVAGIAMTGGALLLPRVPGFPDAPVPLGSALLGTGTLVALVYGATRATDAGWTDPGVLLALGSAVLAGTCFVLVQRWSATPMLPLHLLADRARAASYLAVATAVVGSLGLSLMLTYHFQEVLGWGPLHTGLAFLPLSAAVAGSGTLVSGALGARVARRWLISAGLLVASAGVGLIGTLTPDSGYLTLVLPALLLVGLGMGGVFAPAIGVVTDRVAPRDAGVAAAVANTAMQVGGSLGVALVNTIAVTATRDALATGSAAGAAMVHGYAVGATATAVALVLVALVAVLAVTRPVSGEE